MTTYAVTLQIWDLSRSNFAVGALGFVFAPMLVFATLGGLVADTVDRRRLGLATSAGQAATSVLFSAQAFAGFGQLWLLYLLTMMQAVLQAAGAPARRTFITRLLPGEQITIGVALNTIGSRVATLLGPALAGVITAAWGLKCCYLIDTASFVAVLYPMFRLPVMPPDRAAIAATADGQSAAATPAVHAAARRHMPWSAAEGLQYIRRTPVLLAAFACELNAMVFALPTALFPGLNAAHFGDRPQTLGLLTAALGCGGLISAGLSGPAGRVIRQGRGLLYATAIWGIAIAAFALVRSLPLALLLLAAAGAADTFTVVFRGSITQTITPEKLRGRVSSVEYIAGIGGAPLGNVESGAVAVLAGSATASAFLGGAACLAGSVFLALVFPALYRYEPEAPTLVPVAQIEARPRSSQHDT
jgi:MFS family permease